MILLRFADQAAQIAGRSVLARLQSTALLLLNTDRDHCMHASVTKSMHNSSNKQHMRTSATTPRPAPSSASAPAAAEAVLRAARVTPALGVSPAIQGAAKWATTPLLLRGAAGTLPAERGAAWRARAPPALGGAAGACLAVWGAAALRAATETPRHRAS